MLITSSIQLRCQFMSDSVTPWTAAHQASLSLSNAWSLLKLMSIELVMTSNHLVLSCPLLLPSIFLSIGIFSNEPALCIRGPKDWSISPSNEYSGLISFRIDWFDLLAVWGTLKPSTPQFRASTAKVENGNTKNLFLIPCRGAKS